MPYLKMTCRKCGHSQKLWHNKRDCPKCGAADALTGPERAASGDAILSASQRRLIRAARERRGLSRVEAAELCGLGYTTIAQLEAGTRNLRIELLRRLCESIGLAVDVVIREDGKRPAAKHQRRAKKGATT